MEALSRTLTVRMPRLANSSTAMVLKRLSTAFGTSNAELIEFPFFWGPDPEGSAGLPRLPHRDRACPDGRPPKTSIGIEMPANHGSARRSQILPREGYRSNKGESAKIESRLLPDSGNSLNDQRSDEILRFSSPRRGSSGRSSGSWNRFPCGHCYRFGFQNYLSCESGFHAHF